MLQCLKRGSAVRIERNDLPVEHNLLGCQIPGGLGNPRIHPRESLVVARADLDVPRSFDDQCTVTILIPTSSCY
jgi:hypothetical protein